MVESSNLSLLRVTIEKETLNHQIGFISIIGLQNIISDPSL